MKNAKKLTKPKKHSKQEQKYDSKKLKSPKKSSSLKTTPKTAHTRKAEKAKHAVPVIQSIIPKPIKHKKGAIHHAAAVISKKHRYDQIPSWKYIATAAILIILLITLMSLTKDINDIRAEKTGLALYGGEASAAQSKASFAAMVSIIIAAVLIAGVFLVNKKEVKLEDLKQEEQILTDMSGKHGAEETEQNEEEGLKKYISAELQKGASMDNIKKALHDAEWDEKFVEDAMKEQQLPKL